jgi:hypothetical protein
LLYLSFQYDERYHNSTWDAREKQQNIDEMFGTNELLAEEPSEPPSLGAGRLQKVQNSSLAVFAICNRRSAKMTNSYQFALGAEDDRVGCDRGSAPGTVRTCASVRLSSRACPSATARAPAMRSGSSTSNATAHVFSDTEENAIEF